MDMSFIFLVAVGFLTGVLVAGFFQTVTAVVVRRVREQTTQG
jgi:hypothetical protein